MIEKQLKSYEALLKPNEQTELKAMARKYQQMIREKVQIQKNMNN
jgi:hypothetical protein